MNYFVITNSVNYFVVTK